MNRLSRREFLALTGVAGSGLMLGVSVAAQGDSASAAGLEQLNLFVSLDVDGRVDIIAHRAEMGTGIRTSLPQVVADEMEADWNRVRVVQGLANTDYGSQNTDGSRSIRNFYMVMRRMGAAAKAMLEAAAAQRWQVPVSQCSARNHAVFCSDGRSLGFGELAADAAKQALPDLETLALKSSDQFRYIGRSLPAVDLFDMTTGNAVYGIDVKLPNMLYASIERAPVLAAQVGSYDQHKALSVANVVAVHLMPRAKSAAGFQPVSGVAVLAKDTWSAIRGREQLNVRWQYSAHRSHDSKKYLDELERRVQSGPADAVRKRGDAYQALEQAQQQVSATYRTAYLAHAPMEPPVATARVDGERCEIWACTQTPQATQREVATALGVDSDNVTVHVTLLGGGFGRKSKPDFAVEAALLARSAKVPVQVVWSREDDIKHDYFHACAVQHYSAALDDKGAVTAWLAREAAPSIASTFNQSAQLLGDGSLGQSFASMPFDVASISIEQLPVAAHTRIGWLRSVYNIPFAFGMGSFVDELAAAKGVDPRDFWLQLIGPDRELSFAEEGFNFSNYGKPLAEYPYDTKKLKQVIRELTATVPWGEKLPPGQGWGLAAARSFLSYVAVICKVQVENDVLKVLEMHCMIDAGTVVNPDRVHAQLEGAMVFGLSLALMGEISFEQGEAMQSNFHDYPVARMHQVPAIIRTHIIPSSAPPAGVGEPGVPPVAPAIGNAVFAATGQRLRELPFNTRFSV